MIEVINKKKTKKLQENVSISYFLRYMQCNFVYLI